MTPQIDLDVAGDFGTALLIGALLGLEREQRNMREGSGAAGLRSFVLLTQVGAIGGFLAVRLQMPWMLVVSVLAATAVVVAGYVAGLHQRPEQVGVTSELAAVAACLLGALATTGHRDIAVVLGVATAALLAYKQPLHNLVGKLGQDDVLVGMRFLLATFIVLPLLPDEAVDPWGAINPHKLWLLVLLIASLSLVGYIGTRWLGPGRGLAITAVAGGLASSTATTLAMVRQSRERAAPARQLAGGILLAWVVMFGRVLVAVAVLYPPLLGRLAPALSAMALGCAGVALVCMVHGRRGTGAAALPVKNPFSLLAAGKFALLFAAVQLLLKLGQQYLPASSAYVIAALAGLTDVDAITLSMAERARSVPDDAGVAVTAIVIACVANTLVKAGIAVIMGKGLARAVLAGTAAALAAGIVVLLVY